MVLVRDINVTITASLFRYPFQPVITAVARKRSRGPFCQTCRWQVTAKHACALRMSLCMKWHSAWLCAVHRTRRDGSSFTWHQPCNNYKKTTPFRWTFKTRYKKLLTHLESRHSSGAVWESRWPSWAVRPNEPSGFRGRKAMREPCFGIGISLSLICQLTSEDIKQHYLPTLESRSWTGLA